MSNFEIMQHIQQTERMLYNEYLEQREYYGDDDAGTKHSFAQWGAISSLLDEIIESTNTNAIKNEA